MMPYFKYRGVTLSGDIKKGKMFAASFSNLDSTLLKRDIACISAIETSTYLLPRMTQEMVMHFLERLSMLLQAGILLPDALVVLRDSFGNIRMQLVIADIHTKIEQGIPLHKALEAHKDIFDARMVHMVYIGQETGSLAITMQVLADYLQTAMDFRAKIKSAMMGPLISCVFFLGIVIILVVGIIPILASVFESAHQQLPSLTRGLLAVSYWFRSWYGIGVMITIAAIAPLILRFIRHNTHVKHVYDKVILRIPYLCRYVYDVQRVRFLDSLALLVRGKVPLNIALSIAQHACTNHIIYAYVVTLGETVSQGKSLSSAFQQCPGELFSQEDCAIVAIGESSCRLSSALSQVADNSRSRIARSIHYVTTFIQPLLLIALGLMVTLLILAIYAPIFTLSWAII
jgi:type II secretory pathway component PulF